MPPVALAEFTQQSFLAPDRLTKAKARRWPQIWARRSAKIPSTEADSGQLTISNGQAKIQDSKVMDKKGPLTVVHGQA